MSDTLVCVILIPRSHMTPPSAFPFFGLFLNIPCAGWFTGTFPSRMRVFVCVCLALSLVMSLLVSHCFHTSRCTYRVLRECRVPKHNYEVIDAISTTVKNSDVKACYVYLCNMVLPLNAHSKRSLLEWQSTSLCVWHQVLHALKPPVVPLFFTPFMLIC